MLRVTIVHKCLSNLPKMHLNEAWKWHRPLQLFVGTNCVDTNCVWCMVCGYELCGYELCMMHGSWVITVYDAWFVSMNCVDTNCAWCMICG